MSIVLSLLQVTDNSSESMLGKFVANELLFFEDRSFSTFGFKLINTNLTGSLSQLAERRQYKTKSCRLIEIMCFKNYLFSKLFLFKTVLKTAMQSKSKKASFVHRKNPSLAVLTYQ